MSSNKVRAIPPASKATNATSAAKLQTSTVAALPKATMTDGVDQDEDEDDFDEDQECEMELIYEDDDLRREYEEAKSWLDSLAPKDLLLPNLYDADYIAKLKVEFNENKPYKHLVIENLIDTEFLEKILDEIKTVEYVPKNNDLYLFHQSALDLKSARSPLIQKLCAVLYSEEFISILKEITGLPLFFVDNSGSTPIPVGDGEPVEAATTTSGYSPNKADMFSAVYQDTCRLLCHDDELEGRRIAYILYLTPNWDSEYGGQLDLFNHASIPSGSGDGTSSYIPTTIGASYTPKFAQFAMFEVGETSFHQVREVAIGDKDRISISGWFHGDRIVRQHPEYIPSPPPVFPPQNTSAVPFIHNPFNMTRSMTDEQYDAKQAEIVKIAEINNKITMATLDVKARKTIMSKEDIMKEIKYWINPIYLEKQTQRQTQERFQNESSVDLQQILKPHLYAQLLQELVTIEKTTFDPLTIPATAFPQLNNNIACNTQPDPSVAPIEFIGPCMQRCYYRFNTDRLKTAEKDGKATKTLLYRFTQFLYSQAFYILLRLLTDLELESTYHELRLLRPGCYTLAHDNDPEISLEGVDIIFSLYSSSTIEDVTVGNVATNLKTIDTQWDQDDFGGSRHYLVAGEEEELLTVAPPSNTLSVIFRSGEEDVLQFDRYVNHSAPGSIFRWNGIARLLPEEEELPPPKKTTNSVQAKVAAAQAEAAKKAAAKKK